jgi:hypothetical protein
MYKVSPNNIQELKENEIFVFGSNLQGNHIGGAARIAYDKFGAIMYQGIGLQGQSYAIPTLDFDRDISDRKVHIMQLKNYINEFIMFAITRPNKTFFVTEIGCGIAGFTPEQIAPLFKEALHLNNVHLPQRFINILTPKTMLNTFMEELQKEADTLNKRLIQDGHKDFIEQFSKETGITTTEAKIMAQSYVKLFLAQELQFRVSKEFLKP